MTDKMAELDAILREELDRGIITLESIRAFIHPRLDAPPEASNA